MNLNFELSEKQKETLKKIIPDCNTGHELSFYLCCNLIKNDNPYPYVMDYYIDGSKDRGIDFVLVRVNDKIMTFNEIRSVLNNDNIESINICVFQCKKSTKETTSLSENELTKIQSIFSSLESFCKNKIEKNDLLVNDRVIKFLEILKLIYDNQHKINDIYFEYNYINTVLQFNEFESEKVKNDLGKVIESIMVNIYDDAKITFDTFSKTNLDELFIKYLEYEKEFNGFTKCIDDEDGLLGLMTVRDFFEGITDRHNSNISDIISNFSEIIFESNVRSFLGKTEANTAMKKTCKGLVDGDEKNGANISFWKKNNGISILCNDYKKYGNGVLKIYNLKVINGMQTIYSILSFMKEEKNLSIEQLEKIKVELKVTKNKGLNNKAIESIIIATNLQSQVKYLDLISIDKDLKALEFKLYDNGIDYIRKKKQSKKENCKITIKHNELLQLIITCFEGGPSAAKNNLKSSLYKTNSENEKVLIDFKPYWATEKFSTLLDAINTFYTLKEIEKSDKQNEVLKYAKLHTVYCFINCMRGDSNNITQINKAIDLVKEIFQVYNNKNNVNRAVEKISKNISKDKFHTIYKGLIAK